MDDFNASSQTLTWKAFVLAALEPLASGGDFELPPNLNAELVEHALSTFLTLDEGETLLALTKQRVGYDRGRMLAITNQRVIGAAPFGASPRLQNEHNLVDTSQVEAWSVSFERMPKSITVGGTLAPKLFFDKEFLLLPHRLRHDSRHRLAEALVLIGEGVGSSDPLSLVSNDALQSARSRLATYRPTENSEHQPRQRFVQVPAQTIVTRLLVVACIAIYALMVTRGVPMMDPSAPELLSWGGGFGIGLALHHEYWRLVTPIFLHGGLIHLLLNMACLWQLGRFVETVYGSIAFTLIFLFAGIGGSLLSAWWNPPAVGVGASGAIFGLIGALLVFLAVHRKSIPLKALKSIRTGMLLFLVYNLLPGLFIRAIDTAAHVGGLLAGAMAALFLTRPWPVKSRHQGLIRQLLLSVVPAAILAGLAVVAIRDIPRRAPETIAEIKAEELAQKKATAFNELQRQWEKPLAEFQTISQRYTSLLPRIDENPREDATTVRELAKIGGDTGRIEETLGKIRDTISDAELRAMADAIVTSLRHFELAVARLGAATENRNKSAPYIQGPDGVNTHIQSCKEYMQRYETLMDEFKAKYHLDFAPIKPAK